MPINSIVIIGAGGHAKVVVDALLLSDIESAHIQFFDDNPLLIGKALYDTEIKPVSDLQTGIGSFHVAIGHAGARERLFHHCIAMGYRPLQIIHPKASVSTFAQLGEGVFIGAHAVIAPMSRLGCGVIVNHGAVVDHDCVVEAFAHVAPNATLGGGSRIDARVLIGSGANVLPGMHIQTDAVVGAGAVVVENILPNSKVAGVPAKQIGRG